MSEEPEKVIQVVWMPGDRVAVQHTDGVTFQDFAIASAVILRAGNKEQDRTDAQSAPKQTVVTDA